MFVIFNPLQLNIAHSTVPGVINRLLQIRSRGREGQSHFSVDFALLSDSIFIDKIYVLFLIFIQKPWGVQTFAGNCFTVAITQRK